MQTQKTKKKNLLQLFLSFLKFFFSKMIIIIFEINEKKKDIKNNHVY
jgi:hypothetical protein